MISGDQYSVDINTNNKMESIDQLNLQPVIQRELDIAMSEYSDKSSYRLKKIMVASYSADSLDESEMREIAQQFKISSDERPINLDGMNKFDNSSPRFPKECFKAEEDDSSSSESGNEIPESKQNYSDTRSFESYGDKKKEKEREEQASKKSIKMFSEVAKKKRTMFKRSNAI